MNSPDKPVSALGSALVAAAALAGFVLIFIAAGNFGFGARLFPRVLGIVGGLAAAVVLAQSGLALLAQQRRRRARAAAAQASSWKDVVISYVGPPAYALLLYLAGFWLASILGLAGLLLLLGERRPLVILSITAGTLLAIYLMFEFSFGIRMPRGVLLDA